MAALLLGTFLDFFNFSTHFSLAKTKALFFLIILFPLGKPTNRTGKTRRLYRIHAALKVNKGVSRASNKLSLIHLLWQNTRVNQIRIPYTLFNSRMYFIISHTQKHTRACKYSQTCPSDCIYLHACLFLIAKFANFSKMLKNINRNDRYKITYTFGKSRVAEINSEGQLFVQFALWLCL